MSSVFMGVSVSVIILIAGLLLNENFMMMFGAILVWMSMFTSEVLKKQQEQERLFRLLINSLNELAEKEK